MKVKSDLHKVCLILMILAAGIIVIMTRQSVEGTVQATNLAVKYLPALFPQVTDPGRFGDIWRAMDLNNPRRLAHIYEFFIFGFSTTFFMVTSRWKLKLIWKWMLGLLVTILFSLADQTDKLFVIGRHFDSYDLFLDALGYVSAALLVLILAEVVKAIEIH